jgi:hypothetical protein
MCVRSLFATVELRRDRACVRSAMMYSDVSVVSTHMNSREDQTLGRVRSSLT